MTIERVVGWEFILSQLTREPWEHRQLPQWGLGAVALRATPVNYFWSTQFRVILRVLVYSGSSLLVTITPKYKKIENITGVRKVEFHASIFSCGSNASERVQRARKFCRNDRQTIK